MSLRWHTLRIARRRVACRCEDFLRHHISVQGSGAHNRHFHERAHLGGAHLHASWQVSHHTPGQSAQFLPFDALKECESPRHIRHTASAQPYMRSQLRDRNKSLFSSQGRRGTLYRADRGADWLETDFLKTGLSAHKHWPSWLCILRHRAGEAPSTGLTEVLTGLGFETDRLKTGTPARVDSRTVNLASLEAQPGDADVRWFSFDSSVSTISGTGSH